MMLLSTIILCFLLLVSILLILLLLSTITLRISCTIRKGGVSLDIGIGLWGREWVTLRLDEKTLEERMIQFFIQSKDKKKEQDEHDESGRKKWPHILERLLFDTESLIQANQKILAILHFQDIRWRTEMGLGEAQETAIGCGIIWALKASLLKLISNQIVDEPDIQVVPFFQTYRLQTMLSCMISFKLGKAMVRARQVMKFLKRRGETCPNTRSRG